MAIQNRRGNFVDFDPHKMLTGEFAYTLDTEELYYCVSPGNVKRCATKEEVIEILETSQDAYNGLQQLLTELEDETVATGILNDISDLIIKSNKNENDISSLVTKSNKNENDITELSDRQIGDNLAIKTNQYYQALNFFLGRAYLSPTGMTSLKEGDIVTLSAYLSDITVAGGVALEVAFGDANDAEIGVVTGEFVTTEGLYSFTFTIPQGAVVGDISARLQTTDSLDNGARIRNLKLELGNLVTPWKPSIYRLPTLEYELNTHLAESAKKHINESGSNNDGYYIKFDDGTMDCYKTLNLGSGIHSGTGEYGNPYRTNVTEWVYPKPFIETPNITATAWANETGQMKGFGAIMRNPTSSRVQEMQAIRLSSSGLDATVYVNCRAVGRWK